MSYTFTSSQLLEGKVNSEAFASLQEGSSAPSLKTAFNEETKTIKLVTEDVQNIGKSFSLFVNCILDLEGLYWQSPVSGLSDPFEISFHYITYVPDNRKPVLQGPTEFTFRI